MLAFRALRAYQLGKRRALAFCSGAHPENCSKPIRGLTVCRTHGTFLDASAVIDIQRAERAP